MISLELDQNGSILVGGGFSTSGPEPPVRRAAVARVLPSGLHDTTFGTDGVVSTDLGGRTDSLVMGLAVDSAGRIDAFAQADTDAAAIRFTGAGTLDPSFGTGGAAFVPFGQPIYPGALTLQSDGRIVIAAGINSLDPRAPIQLARFVP